MGPVTKTQTLLLRTLSLVGERVLDKTILNQRQTEGNMLMAEEDVMIQIIGSWRTFSNLLWSVQVIKKLLEKILFLIIALI